MKYVNANNPFENFENTLATEALESAPVFEKDQFEELTKQAIAIESVVDEITTSGLSKASLQLLQEAGVAIENADYVAVTDNPSIRGLSFALEDAGAEKKNIFRRIYDTILNYVSRFTEWFTQKWRTIRDFISRQVQNLKEKVTGKKVAKCVKAAKNPKALSESLEKFVTDDKVADAIEKTIEDLGESYQQAVENLNKNEHVKYCLTNIGDVDNFLSSMVDNDDVFERVFGGYNSLLSAMANTDELSIISVLKTLLANLEKTLPTEAYFKKRLIRVDSVSKNKVEISADKIESYYEKSVKTMETIDKIYQADGVENLKRFNQLLKDNADKVNADYSHYENKNIANTASGLTRVILSRLSEVITNMLSEYESLHKLSMAIMLINNTLANEIPNKVGQACKVVAEAVQDPVKKKSLREVVKEVTDIEIKAEK